ncbi:MAG: hypothetical protein Q9218_005086 [Villophora microphyllina]
MGHQSRQSPTNRLPFQQLLQHNDLGIIENPLRRIPEDDLNTYIESFHGDNNLGKVVDIATLVRGARLARDEEAFVAQQLVEESLTEVEQAALDKEKRTSIWTETREIKIILLICCVGSVVQGWPRVQTVEADFADPKDLQTQGAIVAPNQRWPGEFGLKIPPNQLNAPEPKGHSGDIWLFSATNAIVYFAASSVGAFLCDPLTEIFVGRRGAIFVAALFTFTASIGEAFTHRWQTLFACRFLLGIGMGAKSSVIPIYESEVSLARLRGQILTSWQTGTALGIAISGAIPLIATSGWQFQISSSFIPALALLLLVYVGSESPRWLIKKQRYDEAYIVLSRLRGNPLLAARDLTFIWAQLQVETTLFLRTDRDIINLENRIPYLDPQIYRREIGLLGYGKRITQLFTIPRARRATLASFLVMTAQQMSGVNVFAFLASTLFAHSADTGDSDKGSLDKGSLRLMGRRWLLMLSLAAMFPLLLATAFSFKAAPLNATTPLQQGLVATFLVLYTMAYSPGAGVVPFLYSSEIFPQVLREVGMAWSSAVCWLGAGILDLCVPALISKIHQTKVLCLFAGLDALALCLVWLFVPGTERQIATMEEMNYVFGVATRRHMQYQVKEVAPWCYDHYIRRRRGVDLAPLYRYASAKEETNDDTDDSSTQDEQANAGKHQDGAA